MRKPLFWVYLALAAIGLATAWIFNGLAVASGQDFGSAWTAMAFVFPLFLALRERHLEKSGS